MALLGRRDDRQERREERRGGGSDNEVFQMREKLVSFGDDYWIETMGGRRAFKVDGKVARIRDMNRPDFRSVLQARMELDEQEVFAGDA